MQIIINASEPSRTKRHMEAAWVSIQSGEAAEVYTFKDFSVGVYRRENGDLETRETPRG